MIQLLEFGSFLDKSLWKLVIGCLVSIIRVRKLVWIGFNCFVHGDYWFKYLMVFRVFQNSRLVSLGSNSLAIVTNQYVQATSGYIFEFISKYCSKVLFFSKYFSIDSKYCCSFIISKYCSYKVLLFIKVLLLQSTAPFNQSTSPKYFC